MVTALFVVKMRETLSDGGDDDDMLKIVILVKLGIIRGVKFLITRSVVVACLSAIFMRTPPLLVAKSSVSTLKGTKLVSVTLSVARACRLFAFF